MDEFPEKPNKPLEILNIPKNIVGAAAEGVCDTLSSPVTIGKGLVEGNIKQVVGGVLDAAGGVEIVGSPATYLGRKAFGETGGRFLQEKLTDWAEKRNIVIPESITARGHDCLHAVFKNADLHSGPNALDTILENSAQARMAFEKGSPGLY